MVFVAAGKVIVAVSGLAVIAILTRYLGPEAFGDYRTVVAYTSFAYLTSDLGLYAYTLRAISEPGADKVRLVSIALGLRVLLAFGFLSAAAALSLVLPFSATVQIGIALAILGYICHGGSDLLLAAFQSELRQYQFATTEVVGGLSALLLAYVIVINDLGAIGAVGALVGGFIATFVTNLALIRRSLPVRLAIDLSVARTMLLGSMPLAGALIFTLIYSRMDIVFLSLMQTPRDVGIYGITHKVSDVTMALPYFFAGLAMPKLTLAAINNKKKFEIILSKSFTAMSAGGVGTALLIVLFADVFIELLAGPEYSAGASALKIIGVKIGLFFVANLLVFTTTALNMQGKMLRGHAVAAIVSVIAYFMLIPRLTYDGAAIASTLAEIIVLLYALALVTGRYGRIISLGVPVRCVLSAAVSYGLITQTAVENLHWAYQFVFASVLYLVFMVIFRTGAWSAFHEIIRR